MHFYFYQEGSVFRVACPACKQNYKKMETAWVKDQPDKFWSGSDITGLLSEMLQNAAIDLGGGPCSPSDLLVAGDIELAQTFTFSKNQGHCLSFLPCLFFISNN